MTPFPDSIRRATFAAGGVVLDLRRGTMFRVNSVGAKVMDLLEQGDSLEQIARKLSAEFGVALSTVEADVTGFVESLKARGVVVSL
jgi:Coenzyme PQQ synthesis protein D (PqqD)